MSCPSCGATAAEGKRFCADCGAALARSCPGCGALAVAGKRFCADCGTPLDVAPTPAAPAADAANLSARVAERRVTSVLFADLVGFTTLSESRDPEDVRELLSQYFAAARLVVARYGGTIEKFIGDAVMAVWGVPSAHENDAERAVRAGLDLVVEVSELGHRVGASGLSMRVGVVTGEVAVTLGAVGEGMVAGDAVNAAARVQTAAEPGQVWVDRSTRDLSSGAIGYVPVGEHALKGKSAPLALFAARAVIGDVGGSQRVDGLEAPFVGRDRDLRLVKELFHATAEEGRPRLVCLSGVAGVGKSRLAWEFEKYADGILDTNYWHRSRALSYGDGVAFWPLAEMVRARLHIADGDPIDVMADRLAAGLDELVGDADRREWLRPRLATLLGLEVRGGSLPREDLFAAWTYFFDAVSGSARKPVVMVFEDMQYADAALLDFIEHLLETARFPAFLLTLARPDLGERRPSWGSGRRVTTVYLEPLAEATMAHLVDGLVDGLPAAARQALVDRSEGIPLYAVETVRMLIDRDAVIPRDGRYVLAADAEERIDLHDLGAPATLQALIAARLDSLTPEERQTVADASVHGLAFSREALAATSSVADLDAALAGLTRKEILTLLTDRFSAERGQYRFEQSLVRTVAYDTLSRRDRKRRHLAVAAFLQGDTSGTDEIAAVLARHYLDALDAVPDDDDADELRGKAVALLDRAARRAESLGSQDEAMRHYLTALDREPDAAAQARLCEGAARTALAGNHPVEAEQLGARARGLYEENARPVEAARAAATVGAALIEQSRLAEAIDLMAPCYDAANDDRQAGSALLPLASELARAHFYRGDNLVALGYADRALKLAESVQDWPAVVACLNRYAVCWMADGAPTGGIALLQAAVELARQHHLPHAASLPLANLTALNMTRDLAAAQQAGREALELAEQAGSDVVVSTTLVNVVQTLWFAGEWDEIDDLYAGYQARMRPADRLSAAVVRAVAHAARGQLGALSSLPQIDAGDDPFVRTAALLAKALTESEAGRLEEASDLAAEAERITLAKSGFDDDFGFLWPLAVEFALAAARVDLADALVTEVANAAPGLVPRYVHAQQLRLRGLVAHAQGTLEEADALLADAAQELRGFGAPFYLARALLERGRVLGARGEDVRAEALLSEARAVFAGLAASPWVAEADAALTASV